MPFGSRPLIAVLGALGAFVGLCIFVALIAAAPASSDVLQPNTAASTEGTSPLDGTAARRHRKFPGFFRRSVGGAAPCDGPEDVPTLSYMRGEFPDDARRNPIDDPVPPNATAWIGTPSFMICAFGFGGFKTVVLRVTWPDGRRTEDDLDSPGARFVPFPLLPGMPLGRYEVTATQGKRFAQGTIDVRRPTARLFDAMMLRVQGRDRVMLVLAGFGAHEAVRVASYHIVPGPRCAGPAPSQPETETACYQASFVARADAEGEGLPLVKPRFAPRGDYMFAIRGRGPGSPNGCVEPGTSTCFQPFTRLLQPTDTVTVTR